MEAAAEVQLEKQRDESAGREHAGSCMRALNTRCPSDVVLPLSPTFIIERLALSILRGLVRAGSLVPCQVVFCEKKLLVNDWLCDNRHFRRFEIFACGGAKMVWR